MSRNHAEYDPLQKITWLVDSVSSNWRRIYKVDEHLSFDESMVGFKGWVAFWQYFPLKQTKYGIKIWGVSSSLTGYTSAIDVYTAKRCSISLPIHETIIRVLGAFLWRGHTIYLDNYFTSLQLGREQLRQKTLMVGTMKANRVPSSLKIPTSSPRGTLKGA